MSDPHLNALAVRVLDECKARRLMLATAESCTGGLIAGALTDIPGSSAVVERGFVTYSNAAKSELLGVPAHLIEAHGAVSEPVARSMAEGALRGAPVDLAISVTGVAGPGGSEHKPEGLVHFACAAKELRTLHAKELFGEIGRENVRARSVERALHLVLEMLRPHS